jgi:tungstate transport system substrate-binding protein
VAIGVTRVSRATLIVGAIALAACSERPSASYGILATTTSLQSSGLLDVLLPAFTEDTGHDLRVFLAGSGRALEMLRLGDADVVISHAPEREAQAMHSNPSWFYRKVMFNTFVLVGPADDPARIRSAPSVIDAMRRIARAPVRFVSRGDESGTHERERQLWTMAGAAPPAMHLIVSGAGMSTTLRHAAEARAYTLTDKPSFLRLSRAIDLALLFEGGPELLNTYAVIVGHASSPGHRIGQDWAEWLVTGRGRTMIRHYRVDGHTAAEPWPAGAMADRPEALPNPL